MAKVTLNDLSTTLANSAAATINANNTVLETALEKTLSRDGTGPNQMEADFDLNHNDILNVDNIHADVLVLNGQTVTPVDLVNLPATVMMKPVYDPTGVNGDAFDLDLMHGQVNTDQIEDGAVIREKADDWKHSVDINVKEYGALGNVVNDDTSAFQAAIAAAVASGLDVVVPAGSYRLTSTLVIPDGVVLKGVGRGYEFSHRTKLLFAGTGVKTYTITGATSTAVANPDVGAPYLGDSGTRGDTYRTIDWTVPFSAAIILGKSSALRNLGIYPNFNGVAGYAGTDGALSDDWDVGVWARNSDWWNVEDCNVIGHWRKSGLLVSAHDIGDGKVPSNELGHAIRCHFQGFRGVSIRTAETVVGDNYGFAGTDFVNCLIKSLWHQSRHLATSSQLTTPFSSPSACMEISGDIMRGIQFLNSTFMGRDDIAVFFGKCSEIKFDGCYEEGKSIMVSGAWLADSDAMRMVATSDAVGVDLGLANSKYVVDFSPAQTRDASLTGKRYTSPAGAFNPGSHFDGDYSRRIFNSYIGYRMRKSTDSYRFENENGIGTTLIYADGRVEAGLLFSGTVTIANGAAASIPTPKNGGMVAITCCGSTENGNFPDPLRSGIVFYDVGTAAFSATKFTAAAANFVAVNTDVTGATGTAGNVTVGVIAGNIRVENQAGSTQVFRYFFFG